MGGDSHQAAVPSHLGSENEVTQERKSPLEWAVPVTCFPVKPGPPGGQGWA